MPLLDCDSLNLHSFLLYKGSKKIRLPIFRKPELVRDLSAREFDYPYGFSFLDFLRVLSVPSEAPV